MIYSVKGCSSCPFLEDVCISDSRGRCTLEHRLGWPLPTAGEDRHRLAAVGEPTLVPLRRTPAWCPLRKISVTIALRKRP